jgi:hypothetical protein
MTGKPPRIGPHHFRPPECAHAPGEPGTSLTHDLMPTTKSIACQLTPGSYRGRYLGPNPGPPMPYHLYLHPDATTQKTVRTRSVLLPPWATSWRTVLTGLWTSWSSLLTASLVSTDIYEYVSNEGEGRLIPRFISAFSHHARGPHDLGLVRRHRRESWPLEEVV